MTKTDIKPTETSTQGALVAYDYGSDRGAGFENLTRDDFKVPQLLIIQTNNPQVTEGSEAFIADARPGMMLNSVTSALHDGRGGKQLFVICGRALVAKQKTNEERPRSKGSIPWDSQVVRDAIKRNGGSEFGKLLTEDGTLRLVKTFNVYGILLDANREPMGPVVIPFSSTKITNYQKGMTMIQGLRGDPPTFAFCMRLETYPDKNEKGNFYNLRLEPVAGTTPEQAQASLLPPNSTAYQAARAFAKLVAAGTVKVAEAEEPDETPDPADKVF